MAPRRGGSSSEGNGGGSGSSGSSSCYSSCSITFFRQYGDITGSLYSNTDLYGQIIPYACWIAILLVALVVSLKPCPRLLQLAMFSFICSFAFLCTRYALLLTESDVPIAFRYESSVAVLMWQIGTVALLNSTLPLPKGKATKIYVWIGSAVYAALSITFVVYDFVISSIAVKGYESSPLNYGWKLTDRDFGLTLTQAMLDVLEYNARYYGDSGSMEGYDNRFVHDKLYDVNKGLFHRERLQQTRIGVALDIVALILVVSMIIIAIMVRSKGVEPVTTKKWLIAANVALLPTFIIRAIISTAFVLRNWNVLAEVERDMEIKSQFTTNPYDLSYRGEDFGRIYAKYNVTSLEFPIVQAVIEPLGVVVACIAVTMFWRTPVKQVHQTSLFT